MCKCACRSGREPCLTCDCTANLLQASCIRMLEAKAPRRTTHCEGGVGAGVNVRENGGDGARYDSTVHIPLGAACDDTMQAAIVDDSSMRKARKC